jgi:general secretion pathway protein I
MKGIKVDRKLPAQGRKSPVPPMPVCSGTSGFTLLEVMIALSIIALALVSLLTVQALTVKMSGKALSITNTVLVAREKMCEVEFLEDMPKGESHGEMKQHPDYKWEQIIEEVEIKDFKGRLCKVTVNVMPNNGDKTDVVTLVLYALQDEQGI